MKRLYVGNLPYQGNEQELQAWFAEAGVTVDNVTLMRDRDSNALRGFGFVEISNDDAAERAIQSLNGKEFLGRSLVVNEARPRQEGGGRGERGGGRRRRDW